MNRNYFIFATVYNPRGSSITKVIKNKLVRRLIQKKIILETLVYKIRPEKIKSKILTHVDFIAKAMFTFISEILVYFGNLYILF